MSAFYQLVMQKYTLYFDQFSYIVKRINYWVYNCSYYVGLCTEEICLGLLVRDFRNFLKQQLRALFPCCGKSESSDNHVGHTTLTPTTSLQQRQATNGVVVVRSNIVRVIKAIAINTHRQQQ
jgi:hypothetical protein